MLVTLYVFLYVLILPSSEEMFASSSNSTNKSSNMSGFQATCSTWIGIAPEESQNNSTDIGCLQDIFETCQPYNVTLGYVLGSLRVSIIGLTEDGDCSLNLGYEIERGQTDITCAIPPVKMSTWTNWKRGDGLDAVDQISNYCTA